MRVVEEVDRVEPRGAHGCVPSSRSPMRTVRELYREYGQLICTVAHRVLGRRDLAEDTVQQTFVNAWRAADRFDVTPRPCVMVGDDRAPRHNRHPPTGAAPAHVRSRSGSRPTIRHS